MERADIEHLAKLARLQLTEDEVTKYQKEITDILGYVTQVNAVAGESTDVIESAGVRNVMREDANPMESGSCVENMLAGAPETQDGFVRVQKILDTNNGA